MRSGDTGLEVLIGRVLRVGITASSVCLAIGIVTLLVSPALSAWLLQAGLIILIATPAARVVLSIVEYASARDWTFAVLSAIVLLELMAGAVAALVFRERL
ncbi:MAG: DUF1634 domain-containing protein [Acidobacteria bacterium]|nr:DUF1634 domain-containing protein [Acidobacteriota bacterium]